jgi:hypothetical protein
MEVELIVPLYKSLVISMRKFTIDQIILSETQVKKFHPDNSYLLSYREFLAYFAELKEITAHNFIIGAHFTYGWMPTILELQELTKNSYHAVAILNKAKQGATLTEDQFASLRVTINNSFVGTSKLLHFINPNNYAIWDSRVYRYINGRLPYEYQIKNPKNYLAYLTNCREITQDAAFGPVHASMNEKIGYDVTPLRAVELVMFMNNSTSPAT